MSKWVVFKNVSYLFPEKKTFTWAVSSKDGLYLGDIKWFSHWRQYCFFPENNTIWNPECLMDVASFCSDQMAARKSAVNTT